MHLQSTALTCSSVECVLCTSWKQNDILTCTVTTGSWAHTSTQYLPCYPRTWPTRCSPAPLPVWGCVGSRRRILPGFPGWGWELRGGRARFLSQELPALPRGQTPNEIEQLPCGSEAEAGKPGSSSRSQPSFKVSTPLLNCALPSNAGSSPVLSYTVNTYLDSQTEDVAPNRQNPLPSSRF